MPAGIGAKEMPARHDGNDLPMLNLQELDAGPHGTFRRYRKDPPVVLHESGSYFVLRLASGDRTSQRP